MTKKTSTITAFLLVTSSMVPCNSIFNLKTGEDEYLVNPTWEQRVQYLEEADETSGKHWDGATEKALKKYDDNRKIYNNLKNSVFAQAVILSRYPNLGYDRLARDYNRNYREDKVAVNRVIDAIKTFIGPWLLLEDMYNENINLKIKLQEKGII